MHTRFSVSAFPSMSPEVVEEDFVLVNTTVPYSSLSTGDNIVFRYKKDGEQTSQEIIHKIVENKGKIVVPPIYGT